VKREILSTFQTKETSMNRLKI